MAYANVDRRGIPGIMSAFDMQVENGNNVYALFTGPNLKYVFKGENIDQGRSMFVEELQGLKENGSDAIFTIRFYSEYPKNGVINNKTAYEGSFNFKVSDPNLQPYIAGTALSGMSPDIAGIIGDLRQEIAELKQATLPAPVEVEPEDKWLRIISQFMAIPVVEDTVRGIFKKVGVPMDEAYQAQPSALAGTTQSEFDEALKTLMAADKDFPDVIVKLAKMVLHDRAKYDMAKNFL